MKAITLYNPHAQWICMKWKTIETRMHNRFKGLVGGRIAIHAALKIDDAAFFGKHFMDRMHDSGNGPLAIQNQLALSRMWRGKVLCTAVITEARWAPNVGFVERDEWNRRAMCEVAGKYCLFLDEIRPLKEPMIYKGRQGIFDVPEELIL